MTLANGEEAMSETSKRNRPHFLTVPETLAIHEMLRERLHVFDDKTCEYKAGGDGDKATADDAAAKFGTAINRGHTTRVRKECFGELRPNRRAPTITDCMEQIRDLQRRIESLEDAATRPRFEPIEGHEMGQS